MYTLRERPNYQKQKAAIEPDLVRIPPAICECLIEFRPFTHPFQSLF